MPNREWTRVSNKTYLSLAILIEGNKRWKCNYQMVPLLIDTRVLLLQENTRREVYRDDNNNVDVQNATIGASPTSGTARD